MPAGGILRAKVWTNLPSHFLAEMNLRYADRSRGFLKEHRKVEQMQKQIEALAADLQKVSAELNLRKSGPERCACPPPARERISSSGETLFTLCYLLTLTGQPRRK